MGMMITILFISLQAAITIYALLFERKDERFSGDKLIYRT